MKVTLKELEEAVGTLSNPSKMPGYAWGIPAIHCKRGSKLRAKEGTVCSKCYAMKGRYVFPNVQEAQEKRLDAFNTMGRINWIDDMVELIRRRVKPDEPYFRVFDSGDLQSAEMLNRWDWIAHALPHIEFWMSTRERAIVKLFYERREQPDNLVIRVSADMLYNLPPKAFRHGSTVVKADLKTWEYRVDSTPSRHVIRTAFPKIGLRIDKAPSNEGLFYCPAPLQNNKCGDCRACWDLGVKTVVYLQH